MNKRKRIIFNIISAVIFTVIIFGLFLFWQLIRRTQDNIGSTEDRRLKEQAASADTAVMHYIQVMTETVSGILSSETFHAAEIQYEESGNPEIFSEAFGNADLTGSMYLTEILVMSGGKETARYEGRNGSSGAEIPDAAVPPFSLIRNREGQVFIAFFKESLYADLKYICVCGTDLLFNYMEELALLENTGILLYDGATGVLAADSRNTVRIPDAGAEDSGLTAAVGSVERASHSDTRICEFHDESGKRHDLAAAIIPSGESLNGRIAVGAAVDYTDFLKNSTGSLRKSLIVMSILLAGIICLAVINLLYYRRMVRYEKETIELNRKQRETEERLRYMQVLEQRGRLETIGVLSSSLAHEFNNLLTPVMGYSALALGDLSDENLYLADYLSEIYDASSRARHLTSRMTSFSGNDTDVFRHLSPDAVLEDVRLIAAPAAPRFVRTDISLNCPEPCIYGSRMQLLQMFLNIVLYAYRDMEEKGGTLTVRTSVNDGKVTVSFRYTGKGMTEEEQANVFEPLYSPEGDAGSRLGLPVSKQIAEDHGAVLELVSSPGEGAGFTVIFTEKRQDEQKKDEQTVS